MNTRPIPFNSIASLLKKPNSVFTKAAKILADEVGVILWDGEKLAEMATKEENEGCQKHG